MGTRSPLAIIDRHSLQTTTTNRLASLKQWIELALSIERRNVVATANMLVIDKNLRYRAPSMSPLRHFGSCCLVTINTVFGIGNPFAIEQRLCPNAEGAGAPGVNFDVSHHSFHATCHSILRR